MNYISTKDASSKWNISSRRIEMLASEGRISGAVLVGKNWIIPEDAEKPADGRKKNTSPEEDSRYIFPLPLTYEKFGDLPANATADEIELHKANLLYENGDFEGSIELSKNLYTKTKNKYIRIGILYLCFFSYICLYKFNKADEMWFEFLTEYTNLTDDEHKSEIVVLLNDMQVFSENNMQYISDVKIEPLTDYSDGMLTYTSYLSSIRDIQTVSVSKKNISIVVHEINCKKYEKEGYYYIASLLSYNISIYYAAKGNHEKELAYFKKAIDLAIKGGYYASIVYSLSFLPDLAYLVLKDYPDDTRKKIIELLERITTARSDYISTKERNCLFARLTIEDYKYISYCLKGYKIDAVAKIEGVSLSTAKRYLAYLYDKVGVKGKKQLKEKYSLQTFVFND